LIRGISGGQKRRLSIGVEIIHFPDAIIIDETTTGWLSIYHICFLITLFIQD
jgi:energy-coupling factor transporter ATP-binding protein EcfA2